MPSNAAIEKRPSAQIRKRKWSARSKNGCITCRIRHVKCDEAKPSCMRCMLSNRVCDPADAFPPQSLPAMNLSIQAAPAGIDCSPLASQTFHNFRHSIVASIARGFDHDFWSGDVLKASHTYPAVWHACLALAATFQNTATLKTKQMNNYLKDVLDMFALQQYNLAIRYAMKLLQNQRPSYADKEALLLTTIMFTGLSSLQGNHKQAFVHAKNGVQIFNQWGLWDEESILQVAHRDGILSPLYLFSVISCIEAQIINKLGVDATTLPRRKLHPHRSQLNRIFSSVTEAYHELLPIWNGLTRSGIFTTLHSKAFDARPPPDLLCPLRQNFSVWKTKYRAFLRQSEPHNKPQAVLLLNTLWTGIDVCFRVNTSLEQMCWDTFPVEFTKMTENLEQLIAMEGIGTNDGAASFSFTSIIAELLSFVGHYYRDGVIRRRLLTAVKNHHAIYDGVWNIELVAAMINARMILEENGWKTDAISSCECISSTFICNDHRVAKSIFSLGTSGEANMTFVTVDDMKADRPGILINLMNTRPGIEHFEPT